MVVIRLSFGRRVLWVRRSCVLLRTMYNRGFVDVFEVVGVLRCCRRGLLGTGLLVGCGRGVGGTSLVVWFWW